MAALFFTRSETASILDLSTPGKVRQIGNDAKIAPHSFGPITINKDKEGTLWAYIGGFGGLSILNLSDYSERKWEGELFSLGEPIVPTSFIVRKKAPYIHALGGYQRLPTVGEGVLTTLDITNSTEIKATSKNSLFGAIHYSIAMSKDERYAYVTNSLHKSLSLFSLVDDAKNPKKIGSDLELPGSLTPLFLTTSGDGFLSYVNCVDKIAILSLMNPGSPAYLGSLCLPSLAFRNPVVPLHNKPFAYLCMDDGTLCLFNASESSIKSSSIDLGAKSLVIAEDDLSGYILHDDNKVSSVSLVDPFYPRILNTWDLPFSDVLSFALLPVQNA
ncbi:MAG: hypothetical protein JSR76_01820 [Verrucomicrobia bacterium]|nr:hypothetical protein [Verrucomicrobiota bacterium]